MKPKFKTSYEFCCGCERRMHKVLLDGGVSCRNCRGLNSDGSVAEHRTKTSKEDIELVNS